MNYRAARIAWEKEWLQALLDRHPGNISRAAREAGINRTYIYRMGARLKLKGICRRPRKSPESPARYNYISQMQVRTSWGWVRLGGNT